MKHPTSRDIAKKLIVKTLQEYDALCRKPHLSISDLKTLRRLRETARLAKYLGC